MSFSFNGLGTKEEVIAQLEAADVYGNQVGADAKKLIIDSLKADTAQAASGWEYRYHVQASGHSGGGSPLSLSLNLTTHHVRSISGDVAPAYGA